MPTLYRPRDDRMIAGVCSGIARRFNIEPTIVRILFVASLFLPGPQILIYAAAWLLMPDESSRSCSRSRSQPLRRLARSGKYHPVEP